MKIKYRLVLFITTLTLCILLLPSLVFSGENYKSSLENARILDKDNFYEDAVSYWQKTIDANPPPNITLYANLKLSETYSRLGQLDRAIDISRALTESNPGHYDSWFHLANAFAASREYSQAAEAF
jgi:tetratricopeptide (TPR) repeat protein